MIFKNDTAANRHVQLHLVNDRFKRNADIGDMVFCCVDCIETRKLIWDSVRHRCRFFTDGRMTAEVLRILTACDPASRDHYPTTLFTAQQAYTGSCTAKTTIYCANIAAGLMLAQFAKYLRNLPVEPDLQFNLLSMELSVGSH